MELNYGDNFLEGLSHITNKLSSATVSLSNPNTFPERQAGDFGNYLSSILRNGVDPKEAEETLRQFLFGQNMPGVKPILGPVPAPVNIVAMQESLAHSNAIIDDLKALPSKLGTFGAGVVLPPGLVELASQANKIRYGYDKTGA